MGSRGVQQESRAVVESGDGTEVLYPGQGAGDGIDVGRAFHRGWNVAASLGESEEFSTQGTGWPLGAGRGAKLSRTGTQERYPCLQDRSGRAFVSEGEGAGREDELSGTRSGGESTWIDCGGDGYHCGWNRGTGCLDSAIERVSGDSGTNYLGWR